MSPCLYPFSSLMISPDGSVRLCSSSLDVMGDLTGSSVRDVWRGVRLRDVRETMSEGRWPRACRGCERSEEIGLPSKRRKFLESRNKVWGSSVCASALSAEIPPVMHLDLSFSNLCNLSCVTCSGYYSTGWTEKEAKARGEGLLYQESKGVSGVKRLPPDRIDELLRDFVPQLRTLLIKGGEPLVDPECLRFLEGLAKSPDRRADL
ncbi:MAG TPA: SPASM domain-containing protein, partial [Pseudobdellovibrionaceae bacterium]|nr:SPASM domain-containing protein [Pseudobdellovibrionaceae bacterium]